MRLAGLYEGFRRRANEAAMSELTKPEIDLPEGDAPTELTIRDLVVGDGLEAKPGRVVQVHYVGVTFESGKEFDTSWDRGQTFKFAVGGGKVIKGWDRGVRGMKVGGRPRDHRSPAPRLRQPVTLAVDPGGLDTRLRGGPALRRSLRPSATGLSARNQGRATPAGRPRHHTRAPFTRSHGQRHAPAKHASAPVIHKRQTPRLRA